MIKMPLLLLTCVSRIFFEAYLNSSIFLKVPGYTKKENTQWLYSLKAIELIHSYMAKCPDLFERLAVNVTNDIFQEEELFDKGYAYIVYFIKSASLI